MVGPGLNVALRPRASINARAFAFFDEMGQGQA
jgi:hypothetical protein